MLEKIDAVEYISQYVDLEQQGEEHWGISPFTFPPEKTPSFSVRRETGRFYDFSSGIGGNCFTFTKYYFKCSSDEAVKKLAEYAGVDGKTMSRNTKLAATMVCRRFQRPKQGKTSSNTTVLPENCMLKYEKRLDKLEFWKKEGISMQSMDKFGVCYDGFSNRIVYPIRGPDGKIVNIGGRTLDPAWKEKKLRKYCYFYAWGELNTIYGLYENIEEIKRKHEIILFEGCKSVLLADTWGIHNTGAILTSHLNPNQMKILAKLGCRVVFALDKDVDPRKDHNINRLKRYVNVEYITDDDSLLRQKDAPVDRGSEVFQTLYKNRKSFAYS